MKKRHDRTGQRILVISHGKDDGVRLCCDYRRLNEVTEDDPYCMPRADDLVDRIGQAWYLSTLDMTKEYFQVPMRQEDRQKTAFMIPLGRYQFLRMLFGLKGAPAMFQRLVDDLLDDMGDFTSAYINDVVVYSRTWEDHL